MFHWGNKRRLSISELDVAPGPSAKRFCHKTEPEATLPLTNCVNSLKRPYNVLLQSGNLEFNQPKPKRRHLFPYMQQHDEENAKQTSIFKSPEVNNINFGTTTDQPLTTTTTLQDNTEGEKPELAIFGFKEVQAVCDGMLQKMELDLIDEYDNKLKHALAEQYDCFIKFSEDQLEALSQNPPSYLS